MSLDQKSRSSLDGPSVGILVGPSVILSLRCLGNRRACLENCTSTSLSRYLRIPFFLQNVVNLRNSSMLCPIYEG